jgi:hypothetical protein
LTYTNVRAATRLGAPFKVYVGEVSRFRVYRHSGLYAPAWQALFDQVLPTLAASRDVEPFDIEADYHVNIDGGSHEDGVIAVPTVEFGGLALLGMLTRGTPGYLDNPLRQNMFRAGHAHAGVWLVFALVALLWVDQTDLGEPWKWDRPDRVRGGADSDAAWLPPFGDAARRAAPQWCHRVGVRGWSRPCGWSSDSWRRSARLRVGIG